MDFDSIIPFLPQLAQGVLTTIQLMLSALIIGLSLAILMTLCTLSNRVWLKAPVEAFVFFIRGTPLLAQVYLIYFGSGQFEWLKNTPFWLILREPFACAVIALALNTCAYTVALLKGAIQSVPSGEVAACKALGMSTWLMLRRVILPRAFRIALPAYSNEVIMILKGTSLASTITILDLMGMTERIIGVTYETIEFLTVAAILYLILNSLIVGVFRMLERKANVYLKTG